MDPDAPSSASTLWIATLTAARRSARELLEEDGRWLVYELPAPAYDRRASSCLVFETDGAFHRKRAFPPDWRELDDSGLRALRDGR